MEELFAVSWALFHWRVVLSVVGSAATTLTLSSLFIGFTAGYCVSFVILGTAFGIYGQSRSEAGVGIVADGANMYENGRFENVVSVARRRVCEAGAQHWLHGVFSSRAAQA